MCRHWSSFVVAVCLLHTIAAGQQFSTGYPGSFVDISPSGTGTGTPIPSVGNDTVHYITTMIGNPLFPAGTVTVGNNGLVAAGFGLQFPNPGGGFCPAANQDIPTVAVPSTLNPSTNGILAPFWDDLTSIVGQGSATIYWHEDFVNGVLTIMWRNEQNGSIPSPGTVKFEVKVFGAPGPCSPWIQYLYADTVFDGPADPLASNGLSASIGYIKCANPIASNRKWSFNAASVFSGMVLSILPGSYAFAATSPGGAGTLELTITDSYPTMCPTYVMPVTLSAGVYPNGWLYGLDISMTELLGEVSSGFPFTGPSAPGGTLTIGPFGGLPSGLTFYALAISLSGGGIPILHSAPISYTIP